jgi:hypothetical protein
MVGTLLVVLCWDAPLRSAMEYLCAVFMCRNVVFTGSRDASLKSEINSYLTFVSVESIAVTA